MYKNHEGFNDQTAGQAINIVDKKYFNKRKSSHLNLPFNGLLTYKLINCMGNEIRCLYGLRKSL